MVNPMQSPTDFPFSGHVLFGFILSYLWGLSQYPNIPLLIVLPFLDIYPYDLPSSTS
jgi:hypothetical protein